MIWLGVNQATARACGALGGIGRTAVARTPSANIGFTPPRLRRSGLRPFGTPRLRLGAVNLVTLVQSEDSDDE
jgi:hypothetical protein